MQQELAKAAAHETKGINNNEPFSSLLAEMRAFEKTKVKQGNIKKLYYALKNIAPTSVSCERAFSVTGSFVTSRRACLKDSTIDALCFLKAHFDERVKIKS